MTKAKTTKRALLLSGFALLICVSMLIGSTFAWFTDEVVSANNIIKSGKLDVTMEWADGTTDPDNTVWTDASTGPIFTEDEIWEPGYVSVRHIKIANKGNLAFKYQVSIVANGEVSKLADVIDVYYADPAVQVADRTALTADNYLGTLADVLDNLSSSASGKLLPEKSDTITIALKMKETAGNEYQNLSIGSDFSIKLLATQLTSEEDSFNDQYDKMATIDTEAELLEALAADYDLIQLGANITVTESIVIPADKTVAIDLAGYTMSMVYTDQITASHSLVVNKGDLTILDSFGNGKISYNFDGTADRQWAYAVTTISNQLGTLTIKGGTIESLSQSTNSQGASTYVYKFTVDSLTNGNGGDATLNIEGGKLTAAKGGPVRGFANSTTCTNTINISGGTFVGQVWLQEPAANPAKGNKGVLNISAGNFMYNNPTVDVVLVDEGLTSNITGGTFQHNPAAYVADGYTAIKTGVSTWKVAPVAYSNYVTVATIDELNVALVNATSDVAILFTNDITGNATVDEEKGLNIIIDGNGFTFEGTLYIDGNDSSARTESLLVKNVNFVTSVASSTMISNDFNDDRRYAHNVTVEDCTFTATGAAKYTARAFYFNAPADILIKDCTGTGLHSLLQSKGHTGTSAFVVDGVKLTDCKNGMSFGTNFKVLVKNCDIESVGNFSYGLRGDGNTAGAYEMTVENCKISADVPVQIRKMTAGTKYTLNIQGTNDFIAGDSNYQIIVTSTEYADDVPELKSCVGTFVLNGATGMTVYQ